MVVPKILLLINLKKIFFKLSSLCLLHINQSRYGFSNCYYSNSSTVCIFHLQDKFLKQFQIFVVESDCFIFQVLNQFLSFKLFIPSSFFNIFFSMDLTSDKYFFQESGQLLCNSYNYSRYTISTSETQVFYYFIQSQPFKLTHWQRLYSLAYRLFVSKYIMYLLFYCHLFYFIHYILDCICG